MVAQDTLEGVQTWMAQDASTLPTGYVSNIFVIGKEDGQNMTLLLESLENS